MSGRNHEELLCGGPPRELGKRGTAVFPNSNRGVQLLLRHAHGEFRLDAMKRGVAASNVTETVILDPTGSTFTGRCTTIEYADCGARREDR